MTDTATTTTSLPDSNVGGAGVSKGMSDVQSASVLLQAYTETVLCTPDIKLPASVDKDSDSKVVEDLPVHQALARTNAQFFIDQVNPLLVQRTADVIGFANLWNAEYDQLVALAKDISSGNNSTVFTQGVTNLINTVQKKHDSAGAAVAALNAFLPKITTDSANLTKDEGSVVIALGGEDGAIQQLRQKIDADNVAINKDMAIIAGGACGTVVGGLMIAVGVLLEFETAGASTALIVGGLAVVGGGATAMGIAGKNLSDTQSDLATASKELSIDEAVYAGTKLCSGTIAALETAVGQGITAVTGLQRQWNSLIGDLNQVIEQLDDADPDLGSWLVNTLEAANTDWTDALTLAKGIQQWGNLPVKKVDHQSAA